VWDKTLAQQQQLAMCGKVIAEQKEEMNNQRKRLDSKMTLEEFLQQNFIAVISMILVAIQIYLVYRIDRARLRLERLTGLTEKFGLSIKPKVHGVSEKIILSNSGLVPIEEIEAVLELTLQRKDEENKSLKLKWIRYQVLNSKEEATIPLYEKLRKFLLEKDFIKEHVVETPSGEVDPSTDEPIWVKTSVYGLVKPFLAIVSLEIKSKIEGHSKTVKKKFQFHYDYVPEIFEIPPPLSLEYEDDYRIHISEHMGEWENL